MVTYVVAEDAGVLGVRQQQLRRGLETDLIVARIPFRQKWEEYINQQVGEDKMQTVTETEAGRGQVAPSTDAGHVGDVVVVDAAIDKERVVGRVRDAVRPHGEQPTQVHLVLVMVVLGNAVQRLGTLGAELPRLQVQVENLA